MDVNGLAAVVTGAASGLGEATARALAAGGAMVISSIATRKARRKPWLMTLAPSA